MRDQAIKQATHARTIELSSGTLDRVVTVLSMITSASPCPLESASSVYGEKYRSGGWGSCCTVQHIGHGDGRDKVQTTLHSSCTRPWGWCLKCGVAGHLSIVSVKPNTNQQD